MLKTRYTEQQKRYLHGTSKKLKKTQFQNVNLSRESKVMDQVPVNQLYTFP